MKIFRLDNENLPIVSEFMAKIKPEWWNAEGAMKQLKAGIGWYFGPASDKPKGWLLCKSLPLYRTGEIECLGYNNNGSLLNESREEKKYSLRSSIWRYFDDKWRIIFHQGTLSNESQM